MVKITNVTELEEHRREDDTIFGYTIEFSLSNNETYTQYFSGVSLEEIKNYLYNINWYKEVLDSLERFRQDDEEEFGDEEGTYENPYEKLMKKVDEDMELTQEDLKWINECVRICTFFKEFDYKTWVLS